MGNMLCPWVFSQPQPNNKQTTPVLQQSTTIYQSESPHLQKIRSLISLFFSFWIVFSIWVVNRPLPSQSSALSCYSLLSQSPSCSVYSPSDSGSAGPAGFTGSGFTSSAASGFTTPTESGTLGKAGGSLYIQTSIVQKPSTTISGAQKPFISLFKQKRRLAKFLCSNLPLQNIQRSSDDLQSQIIRSLKASCQKQLLRILMLVFFLSYFLRSMGNQPMLSATLFNTFLIWSTRFFVLAPTFF